MDSCQQPLQTGEPENVYHRHTDHVQLYIPNSLITRSYILSQQNTSALIRFEYFNIVLWNFSFFFQKIQLHQYFINILFQLHMLSLNWASNLLAIDSKSSNYFAAHIFICDFWTIQLLNKNKSFRPFAFNTISQ